MRIAIAGGHSAKAPGASGYLNEYEKDRAFVAHLKPALEAAGHTVVDCSNEMASVNGELAEEVRLANNSGADVFLAIHFNAGGGTGTEVWHYTGNDTGYSLAKTMSANVAASLGLRDRGAKSTTALYVIRRTNMPAVLLETCFVDTAQDATAWLQTAWEPLLEAVVKAFGGEVASLPSEPAPKPAEVTRNGVTGVQEWLNDSFSAGLDVDGSAGPLTKKACVKAAQTIIGTPVDGDFGAKSARAWGGVVYGNVGQKVKVMQAMLICRGYSVGECGLDASCGNATVTAIKAYQRDHGLAVDGSCGFATSQSLFTW